MYRGYIKSWRKVLTSPMFQSLNSVQRDVFWVLLHLANHEEREWMWKGEMVKCSPGQFVTSIASIKALCAKKTTVQNIRTALNRLKTWQFLTNESTKEGRLITIRNWGTYQKEEKKLTKELTADQQRPNKDLTPNKNERMKEVKRKSIKKEKFTPPSHQEVSTYCQERKNGIDPETFIDHYTANGWLVGKNKMKDWKASVRTWERNRLNKKDDDKIMQWDRVQ